jgi:hypothetical protein
MKGLCVVHITVNTWHTDALTKRAVKRPAGYFVASYRLGLLVSNSFADFYKACQYGNFLQKNVDFASIRLKTAEDASQLSVTIARYKAEFDALQ